MCFETVQYQVGREVESLKFGLCRANSTRAEKSRSFASLTQAHGGRAEQAAQVVGQMALVRKAHGQGYVSDGPPGIDEQRSCALHSPPNHVLMHRNSDRTAKCPLAMRNTQSTGGRDRTQRQIVAQMLLDISEHSPQSEA